jgi:hypothetical protein
MQVQSCFAARKDHWKQHIQELDGADLYIRFNSSEAADENGVTTVVDRLLSKASLSICRAARPARTAHQYG